MLSATSEFEESCYQIDKYRLATGFDHSNTIETVASHLTLTFMVHIVSSFILPLAGQYNQLGSVLNMHRACCHHLFPSWMEHMLLEVRVQFKEGDDLMLRAID